MPDLNGMPTFSTMKLTALPETVPCLQRQAKRNLPSCRNLGWVTPSRLQSHW